MKIKDLYEGSIPPDQPKFVYRAMAQAEYDQAKSAGMFLPSPRTQRVFVTATPEQAVRFGEPDSILVKIPNNGKLKYRHTADEVHLTTDLMDGIPFAGSEIISTRREFMNQIGEMFDAQVSSSSMNSLFSSKDYDPPTSKKEIGRGVFSVVNSDKNDPHTVNKTQLVRPDKVGDKDSFESFAKIVIKHKLWDKIHFPRIYAQKLTTDKGGRTQYKWKIERLVPLYDMSKKEFEFMAEKYFVPDVADRAKSDAMIFAKAVRDMVRYEAMEKYIEDEQFLEAVQITRKMFEFLNGKRPRVRLDLHVNNMMVRRTPYGPQLVITDPFAG